MSARHTDAEASIHQQAEIMHTGILLHLQQKVARPPIFVRPDAHTTGDAVPWKRISVTGQVQDSPIQYDDI